MVKRVLFINPPQTQLAQPKAYIPLGISYLAAVLERNNFSVEILNLADTPLDKAVIPQNFDVYGITCVSATYESVVALSRKLKEQGHRVIVGGSHATVMPETTLKDTGCDCVVTGEAESAFQSFLNNAEGVFHCGVTENLDKVPFPARHLFKEEDFIDTTGIHGCERGVRATTVLTSRGCVFNCRFCCRLHPMFRQFRFRSAENVALELRVIQAVYGVEHVRFVDDAFTTNKARVLKLCELIRPFKMTFICITRADMLDSRLLREMRFAGCVECHIGVESGSQRILNLMNKKTSPEVYARAIELIKRTGMRVKTYLMYGFPTETDEDRRATIQFVKRVKPDKVTVSKFVNMPGSDTWVNHAKYGLPAPKLDHLWFYPDKDEKHLSFKAEIKRVIEETD